MPDNLKLFGNVYNGVAGFKASDTGDVIQTFAKPSYTLLATREFTVSTTSTSATSVGNVDAGTDAYTSRKILYVRIRDKAGLRSGYFYGSDSFFINSNAANGKNTTYSSAGRFILLHNGYDTNYWEAFSFSNTTGYGVYAYSVTSAGRINIRSRYNASNSKTIDGTYVVEVYLLEDSLILRLCF